MDARIAIWNTLHDGEITVVRKEGEDLIIFVNIPYLRERLNPIGDSFSLRLKGFNSLQMTDWEGEPKGSDLQEDIAKSGVEILSTESEAMPIKVVTTMGYLELDFEELEISLENGTIVPYDEVLHACTEYWDEWSARTSKKK